MQITIAESGRASPLSFSSLLSFFLDFWWNFRAQMRREGEGWGFYKGGDPGRPRGGGRQAPCRDCGPGPVAIARGPGDRPLSPPQRATGVFFFFPRDFVANLKKK